MPEDVPRRWLVGVAFGAIYLIWGAAALATAFAIETIPPLLMVGVRLIIAGAALYCWARWRNAAIPTRGEWGTVAVVGGLVMFVGVGVSSWAQQWVPSGLSSVLTATVALWMVLLNWRWFAKQRPSGRVALGLAVGLIGIGMIVGRSVFSEARDTVNLFGMGVMILSTLGMAAGSLHASRAQLPQSVLLATGMEMLTGGAMLVVAAVAIGEVRQLDVRTVSLHSALAMAYLVVFSSIVAFTAYFWLLEVSTPTRVSTFAYVNPVVALFLGWALRSEPITVRTLIAAAVVLSGVALIYSVQEAMPDAAGDSTANRHGSEKAGSLITGA